MTMIERLKQNLINLELDIAALDIRLDNVKEHISELTNSNILLISQIDNIKNSQNPDKSNIGKFYNIYNKNLELISIFNRNLSDLLNLKFKYRKEQDDLKFKILKFTEELKIKNTSGDDVSGKDFMNIMKTFVNTIDNNKNNDNNFIKKKLTGFDDNDDYAI